MVEPLLNVVKSGIGGLTNPNKITDTINSKNLGSMKTKSFSSVS